MERAGWTGRCWVDMEIRSGGVSTWMGSRGKCSEDREIQDGQEIPGASGRYRIYRKYMEIRGGQERHLMDRR